MKPHRPHPAAPVGLSLLMLVLGACYTPELGGQEGEEVGGKDPEGASLDTGLPEEDGGSEGSDGGGTDGGGTGGDGTDGTDGGDSGSVGGTEWSFGTGERTRFLGEVPAGEATTCQMRWSGTVTPIADICPDCTASVQVSWTYDEAGSVDDDPICEPHIRDLTETVGLAISEGGTTAQVWLLTETGVAVPVATATFLDGGWSWETGYADDPVESGSGDPLLATDLVRTTLRAEPE